METCCAECGCTLKGASTTVPRVCDVCKTFNRGFDNGHEEGKKAARKEIAEALPSPTLAPEAMEAIKARAVANAAASYRLHHVTCKALYFGDGACNCNANEHNVMVSMYAQVQQDVRYLLAEIERLTKGLSLAA